MSRNNDVRPRLSAAYHIARELRDLVDRDGPRFLPGEITEPLRLRLRNEADNLSQTILAIEASIDGPDSEPAQTLATVGRAAMKRWGRPRK